MNTEEKIAEILLKLKAVNLSTNPPYTWTSGLKAPIYCDNRLIISYPTERQSIIDGFKDIIKQNNLSFDVIAGTATAAIPWAAFLAYELGTPMVYVRPEPKGHGAGKQVEGTMPKNARVLIVEDLISTGKSSIKSAEACEREFNAQIIGVLAIFTYEMEKGKNAFRVKKLPFFTLSNFSTLIEIASRTNYLAATEKENVLAWSKDPENWNK